MKRILILFLSLLLIIPTAGCSSQKSESGSSPNNSSVISDKNPFQSDDEASSGGVLGSIGHEPVNPNRDDNGNIQPFVYDGRMWVFLCLQTAFRSLIRPTAMTLIKPCTF
jgi:ABC-type oligopeptide transport system substrate-binding subunit